MTIFHKMIDGIRRNSRNFETTSSRIMIEVAGHMLEGGEIEVSLTSRGRDGGAVYGVSITCLGAGETFTMDPFSAMKESAEAAHAHTDHRDKTICCKAQIAETITPVAATAMMINAGLITIEEAVGLLERAEREDGNSD